MNSNWRKDDTVQSDTTELARHTVCSLAELAQNHHIPFRDLGDYLEIFIKIMVKMTTLVLLQMLKDQEEEMDMMEHFDFDSED